MSDDEIRRYGPPARLTVPTPERPQPAPASSPDSEPPAAAAPPDPSEPTRRGRGKRPGRPRRAATPAGTPRRRAARAAEAALRHWITWAQHHWSRNPHGVALHRPFLLAVCARYGPHVRDAALADAAFWLTWFLDRWTSERVAGDWEAVQAEISQCLQCLDYCLGAATSPNP